MKNRLHRVFGFILTMFLMTGANAETWVLVDKTIFLDKDSILRHNGMIRVWIKNTDTKNRSFTSFLEQYEIDCDRRTEKLIALITVDLNGTKSGGGPIRGVSEHNPYYPGSVLEKTSQIACKKFYEFWKQ